MAALNPGQRLGPYAIEGPIGKGGIAEVYKATHLALERTVALKVLDPVLNADPTFPLRFLREARAIAKLNHPNIITVYDFDDRGELAYLVMELAPGGTLRERAREFKTLSEAVEALAPVCDALQFAHDRNIIHRDVKPVNVLIDEHKRPRLADFGLARVASESLDVTFLGTSAGSPHYIAPEQALAEEVDHRADIYALGIVTYEVLTGRVPYTGPTAYAVIAQHLTALPPSIRALLPDAPASLEVAIARATAKRREDRFDSVSEFLDELKRAAAEAPDLPVRAALGAEPPDESLTVNPADLLPLSNEAGAAATAGLSATDAQLDATWRTLVPMPVRGRRPTAFDLWQLLALGATLLLLVAIGAGGIWLGVGGPGAGAVTRFYAEHLTPIRASLAGLALVLGIVNATLMKIAVLDEHYFRIETYRRLRQNHRYIGYTAALIAITVEVLTAIAVLRAGLPATVAVLDLAFGGALLVTAVSKVAVVRLLPAYRRYLPALGVTLLVLLAVVFVLSLV